MSVCIDVCCCVLLYFKFVVVCWCLVLSVDVFSYVLMCVDVSRCVVLCVVER
eukprot:m.212196 g.212196  ORF g.212196 m.212196 type:complete len:52 (-) comp33120_c4_seq3:68-223(-)